MPPTPVEVITAQRKVLTNRFESIGTVEAGNRVDIVAEITAQVTQISFREGGRVSRGAVLARLDDAQLLAEYQRAEALRDQSQAAYDRVKRVVDLGAGAPQDLDDAAASLKVAEANVKLAGVRLEKTRIRAPFSGLIGARQVSWGAFMRSGEVLTDLTQIDPVRLRFSIPERYVSTLREGSEIEVMTTAWPDSHLVGTIDFVEPALDPETRSARVVAIVDNPYGLLRPGMSAAVSAVLGERLDALVIPNEAVFVNGNDHMVFVMDPDSTVRRSVVELGLRLADVVEVTGGLDSGNIVVRAGQQKLRDGVKVSPSTSDVISTPGQEVRNETK